MITVKKKKWRIIDALGLDKLEKVELVVTMDGVELLKHPKIISWSNYRKRKFR